MERHIEIGKWFFRVSDEKLGLMPSKILSHLLDRWAKIFPREESWVQKTQGVPSLIIRLDMVINNDGIGVYEVEERPAGIGVTCLLNDDFKNKLSDIINEWRTIGNIGVVVSENRLETSDDVLWAQTFNIPFFGGHEIPPPNGMVYWVRANRDERKYHSLVSSSLSTIVLKGDKGYGVQLGLWDVLPKDLDELPWEKGFVLKPAVGSKMEDVYIWHPDGKKKFDGAATKTKIMNVIQEEKVAYVQHFIMPERHSFLPDGFLLIRRVYWAWSPCTKQYICIGGLWTARKNLRIHGASDAIFGQIIV